MSLKLKRLNIDSDTLPMLLGSGLSFLIVFSFAIYRFVSGEINLGLVDLTISSVLLILFIQAWRYRRLEHLNMLLVVTYMGGTFAALYLKGPEIMFWVYPAVAATYFLLPVRMALPINAVFILATTPLLIPGEPISGLLSIYSTVILVCLFGYIFSTRSENQRQELTQLATIDALTHVENRRSMDDRLIEVVATHARVPLPASILVLDLDYFKKINDEYGHIMGDKVLVHFAKIIKTTIRISDRLYRFGGEEFVIIANNTKLENAGRLAESLRKLVENDPVLTKFVVTVSIGVTEMTENDSKESWLDRADKTLYKAKEAGRNVVFVAKPYKQTSAYEYQPLKQFLSDAGSIERGVKSVVSLKTYKEGNE